MYDNHEIQVRIIIILIVKKANSHKLFDFLPKDEIFFILSAFLQKKLLSEKCICTSIRSWMVRCEKGWIMTKKQFDAVDKSDYTYTLDEIEFAEDEKP